MPLPTLIVDIECYWDYFFVGLKRLDDGVRRGIEMSSRTDPTVTDKNRGLVKRWLAQHQTVGFNSLGYDLPMLWYWILGADNTELKKASDRIILGNIRWWEVEETLDIRIPKRIKDNHIDLIEPQPNPVASLKILNGRMAGPQLQDLPYDPSITPTPEQMDRLNSYCLNTDLDATSLLWGHLEGEIELRRKVSAQIGVNVMSKSDTQMGLAIVKKRCEEALGKPIYKPKLEKGYTFKYTPPEYISFQDKGLSAILGQLREHTFVTNDKGKVTLPKFLTNKFTFYGSKYKMGIGGLHSCESNRAVHTTETHVLCDFDVASYYPAIILNTGIYPKAIGPVFADVYRGIRDERIAAKRAKDKVTDKSLKIALNGTFGSLGSPYSFVYSPDLLIAVTITGQLALLKLIEMAELRGIKVVSGNTDGVVMRIPRTHWAGLNGDRPNPSVVAEVVEEWEKITGFVLEGTEYRSLYNQSVNSYFAIKADGGHKRKGPLGNPWSPHPADNNPRDQLMKNPQMTICSDAALAFIKDGVPIETTIRECTDIRQFVTVIKAQGGATWNGEYLGKVVRYYWSTDGQPIYKAKANESTGIYPKVPKTDGARECMRLPDELPDDLDIERYIAETREILNELGYYESDYRDTKPVRVFKRNAEAVLHTWMVQI